MNDHEYYDGRKRIFVPCEYEGCLNVSPYLEGDLYRRRYCPYHYRQLKSEMIARGASADEIAARLIEVLP